MTMGDRVAVLKDGILQQCDTPRRMYDHPANVFVAGFIGSPAMNLMDVPVTEGGVDLHGHVVQIAREDLANAGKHVTLGVRPEDLELSSDGSGIPVTVDVVEELGADAYVYGTAEADLLEATGENAGAVPFIARVDGRRPPEKGEKVHFKPKPGHVHVFNADSGERLGD
jgi:multiple sugar transport system ATP-binding protein